MVSDRRSGVDVGWSNLTCPVVGSRSGSHDGRTLCVRTCGEGGACEDILRGVPPRGRMVSDRRSGDDVGWIPAAVSNLTCPVVGSRSGARGGSTEGFRTCEESSRSALSTVPTCGTRWLFFPRSGFDNLTCWAFGPPEVGGAGDRRHHGVGDSTSFMIWSTWENSTWDMSLAKTWASWHPCVHFAVIWNLVQRGADFV